MDSPRAVTAVGEVEGQIGEVGHPQGWLLPIVSFKHLPNAFMKTPTSRGAHFAVQAFTDFVVAEEKAPLLVGSKEPCACCLEETGLNSFDLLLFHQGEQ